jgi:hypothetical protein
MAAEAQGATDAHSRLNRIRFPRPYARISRGVRGPGIRARCHARLQTPHVGMRAPVGVQQVP